MKLERLRPAVPKSAHVLLSTQLQAASNMSSKNWRPIMGAGILLASVSLHLACEPELQDSLLNPGNGSLNLSGGNPSGDPTQDPQGGDPNADPTGTTNGGGGSTNDSGTNSAGSDASDNGSQTGGGTLNVTPVDTRPVTLVTTLEDYLWNEPVIVGSLRWALANAPTPGVIRFSVGGAINLKRTMAVRRSELEIDGGTAPNGGITIQRQQFEVRDTHDVVLKNLRFRSGDGFVDDAERVAVHGEYYDVTSPHWEGGQRSLAIVGELGPCRNVRIENCSIQNSTDDNGCVWGDCAEVLFFRCLFSGGYTELTKGLLCGAEPGKALPSFPVWVILQQCLFINEWARMPDLNGDTVHLLNNVIIRPMQGGRLNYTRANVVGNCLFSMPNHPWYANADRILVTVAGTTTPDSLYVSGNLLDGLFDEATKIVGIMNQGQTPLPPNTFRAQPLPGLPANILSAPQALVEVLSKAGCSGPGRDVIDLTQIDQAAAAVGIDPSTVR